MNKIKKLLPLTTLLTTSFVVTPFVVGCSNSKTEAKKEVQGLQVDVETLNKHGYQRKYNPLPKDSPHGIADYLTAISDPEKPDLFADDTFDFWGNVIPSEQVFELPILTKGTITIGNVQADPTKWLLSYAMDIDVTFPYTYLTKDGQQLDLILDCKLTWEFKNIGVLSQWSKSTFKTDGQPFNLWLLTVDLVNPAASPEISVVGTIDSDDGDTKIHTDISLITDDETELGWLEAIAVMLYLPHPISYYQNIERN